ncbi:hypothetical protein [Granulicoccus phenolivorans]|uniref:hypothetical protein n=1 Tax=Granulicoccus phenolivorans TaxID=266854 RepID=UPI00040FBC14|nr:hypothetical protein [Granulicoccus phenolivorans]
MSAAPGTPGAPDARYSSETVLDRTHITLLFCDHRGRMREDPLANSTHDVVLEDPRTHRTMRLAGVRVDVTRTISDAQRHGLTELVHGLRSGRLDDDDPADGDPAGADADQVDRILAVLGIAAEPAT